MNRRSFLGTIGAVAAALVAAPKVLEALEPAGDQTVPITITNQFSTDFGWSSVELFQKGDVFTVENSLTGPIYALNPITGKPTQLLQHFVVVDEVTDRSIPNRPVQIVRAPGLGWIRTNKCRPSGGYMASWKPGTVHVSGMLDRSRWGP